MLVIEHLHTLFSDISEKKEVQQTYNIKYMQWW